MYKRNYENFTSEKNLCKKVNILLGYIELQKEDSNLKNLISNCDLLCFYYHKNYKDFFSSSKINDFKMSGYVEFFNNKKTILMSLINKIINKLYNDKYEEILYCYSYLSKRISLETNNCLNFDLSDEYYLYKQKIEFWEFDVRNCFSRISRLILINVDFTRFDSLYKQTCCIKSLRYLIKEIVWKNFISELLFNNTIKISKIKKNMVSVNFSEQISIIINGRFSGTNDIKGFLSLFGDGKLIPMDVISKTENMNISNYILGYITFNHRDILYFNSIFPVRKVIGPDFHDLNIPESILDSSNRFDSENNIKNKNTAEFTRFIFYSRFSMEGISSDTGDNAHIQILSI